MAKDDLRAGGPMMFPVGGMDESVQSTGSSINFESIAGVSPFYIGSNQRLFGKRLIDNNTEQEVYAIAQAFNGYGQYGYYVQSHKKLYYHLCDTPVSLSIDFTPPVAIGVDEEGHSLDIYGQRPNGTSPPDSLISCLFGFPDKAEVSETGVFWEFEFVGENNN